MVILLSHGTSADYHRNLRPPRGNRRLDSEVDDFAATTVTPNELTVDVVTAYVAMINEEAAAEKNVFKSKVHSCQNFVVMLFNLFNLSVKRIFFLATAGTVILDHFTAQGNMALLETIWFGGFAFLIFMMWFLL
ncbi:hypothetical protein BOTNAR_0118g00010 [Botryotinia narcissicola]|uniref:Uncharacterized protein n=1 Tax=Botryotinia narcissicola TaxID=278944 RepID=A0A4Z1ILC5_9HELO|nr:hypothetical protein BOTNAR_0118g00010 [Botryotinia narcissicola]